MSRCRFYANECRTTEFEKRTGAEKGASKNACTTKSQHVKIYAIENYYGRTDIQACPLFGSGLLYTTKTVVQLSDKWKSIFNKVRKMDSRFHGENHRLRVRNDKIDRKFDDTKRDSQKSQTD